MMRLNKPTHISICFVGGDLSITKNQESNLQNLSDDYIVEFLHRGDKLSQSYTSFSQIINEFVVESKNEFMIFINPKVKPEVYQVEDLIVKLCSGYCWVSRISFGFWAATKELFRNTSLMDERFIGSEYEDNDFILRLKMFNKAIFWEYQLDEYPWNIRSDFSGMRGLSKDVFSHKWYDDGVNVYLNKGYEEKKLPKNIKLKRNYEIFNSWLPGENSEIVVRYGIPGISELYNRNVEFRNVEPIIKYEKCNLVFSGDIESYKIEFLCNQKTHVTVVMINANSQKICTNTKTIYSNTWNMDRFFDDTEEFVEIKIFHCGDKIYHNKYTKIPLNLNLEIGLKIISYEN